MSKGYWMVQDGERQLPLHRYLVEQHLGRHLLPSETVHHKDENPLNNAIENLVLCASEAEHQAYHAGFRSETHKQCSKCLVIKPRSDFSPKKPKKPTHDTHDSWCKACYAAIMAERRRVFGRGPH